MEIFARISTTSDQHIRPTRALVPRRIGLQRRGYLNNMNTSNSSSSTSNDSRLRTGSGGIEIAAHSSADELFTSDALAFVAELHERFEPERQALLEARIQRRQSFVAGLRPAYAAESRSIRAGSWVVEPPPKDLENRRVELVGQTSAAAIEAGRRSGAQVYVADFEDSCSPTWANIIAGQLALRRAYQSRQGDTQTATLMVRVRGWHLVEPRVRIGGSAVSAGLFDYGLCVFHNARAALDGGSGPYFYLPKLETRHEARLWNEVFEYTEDRLGFDRGTVRATALVESVLAAFEMDEICYELREHSAGLNAGRRDYVFSVAEMFGHDPDFLLLDRRDIDMTAPFVRAFAELLVSTSHRRGAHAIGGLAGFVADAPAGADGSPGAADRGAALQGSEQLRRLMIDKRREAGDGFDGTWVGHECLVAAAGSEFHRVLGDRHNQVDRQRDDVYITAGDLLAVRSTKGSMTAAGARDDISVCLQYLSAWLGGCGAPIIDHQIEDLSTVELSRARLWQWLHHGIVLEDGRRFSPEVFNRIFDDEMARLRSQLRDQPRDLQNLEQAALVLETVLGATAIGPAITDILYPLLESLTVPDNSSTQDPSAGDPSAGNSSANDSSTSNAAEGEHLE